MSAAPLRVGIIGCGLIGRKRAQALGGDQLVACFDAAPQAAAALAADHGAVADPDAAAVLARELDVIVVATPHNLLARYAIEALGAGKHVLVEKPAGISSKEVSAIADAADHRRRLVKVGFNHRFHPAIERAITEARSGRFGDVMFARARYGHGGRLGYESEWRMRPEISGGGELIDQGMHILDLFHWLLGPLPLHSALVRTQFWDAPVEDNAVLTLGERGVRDAPWATAHVTWTEWKNMFSMEIYCRTGKLQVDGLAGSYGPQRLTIHAMKPELGPPDTETVDYESRDVSWEREWAHFSDAIHAGDPVGLRGNLGDARYAWERVEDAYAHERGR